MYSLKLPNSPTALRLGAEFLSKLAEQAETVRAEQVSRTVGELEYTVKLNTAEAAEQLGELLPQQPIAPVMPQQLEVATPAPVAPLPGELGSPEMDAALDADQAKLEALGAFAPVPPAPLPESAPEPELAYRADRAGGFTLEQMRDSGWSDQQLVEAGYAEWVNPAPKPTAAPGASAGPVPAPPAAPAPADASTSLDKDGLPWDERIHSSSKAINQTDGLWRKKRGVSDELVAEVEAELRGLMGNAPASGAGAPIPPSAPIAPASVPVPPSAPAPAAGAPTTFAELTPWLLAAIKANKLSSTDVQLAVMSCGVEGVNMLPHLQQRPDLIPQVVEALAPKVNA